MSDLHEYREYPVIDPRIKNMPRTFDHLPELRASVEDYHKSSWVTKLTKTTEPDEENPKKKNEVLFSHKGTLKGEELKTYIEKIAKPTRVTERYRPPPPPQYKSSQDFEDVPVPARVLQLAAIQKKKPARKNEPVAQVPSRFRTPEERAAYYERLAVPHPTKLSDAALQKKRAQEQAEYEEQQAALARTRQHEEAMAAKQAAAAAEAEESADGNETAVAATATSG